MRPALLLLALAAACFQPTAPREPAPPAATIALTSPTFALWWIRIDTTTVGILGLGGAAPLDTARLAADTTLRLVWGTRITADGRVACHDTRWARAGDVVTLAC